MQQDKLARRLLSNCTDVSSPPGRGNRRNQIYLMHWETKSNTKLSGKGRRYSLNVVFGD